MYSIILKNGNIINIRADDIVYYEKFNLVRFYDSATSIIAEINMDNVAGWVRTSCKVDEE